VAKRKNRNTRPAPPQSNGNPHNAGPDADNVLTPRGGLLNSPGALLAVVVLGGFFLLLFYLGRPDVGVIALNVIYFIGCWFGDSGAEIAILDRAPLVAFTVAEYLLAYIAGRLLIEAIGCSAQFGRIELAAFAIAAGLSIFSLMTLIAGVAIGLQSWLFYGPAAVLLVVGMFRGLHWYREDASRPWWRETLAQTRGRIAGDWLARYGGWLASPFVAAILLGSMLPPSDFDVREYHLQAPKEWSQQGSIGFMPHNVYANMPLGAEMHALIAMRVMPGPRSWWWGALAGKLAIACMTLLTALALYCACRRWFHPVAGVVAALTYISIPWVARVSVRGLNEGAFGLYFFLTAYALFISWEQRNGEDRRVLLLAGFMAGSAVAIKYTAMLLVAPVALLAALLLPQLLAKPFAWKPAFNLKAAAMLLAGLIAGGAVWGEKNLLLTGNPVYPLMQPVAGGATRTPAKHAQWAKAHATPPYSIQQAVSSLSGFLWKSEWQSPLVATLGLLAVVGMFQPHLRNTTQQRLAIAVAVWLAAAMLLWWLATHRIDRFWVPMLPLAATLAGYGSMWRAGRGWRIALYVLLGVALTGNALTLFHGGVGDIRYFVSLRELREDGPPGGEPGRVDHVHRIINEVLGEEEAVLLVGGAEPFDLVPRTFYNTCFDDCLLELWMKNRTPAQQREEFRRRNVMLVYVSWSEIARYRKEGSYGFTSYVTPELFEQLVKDGVLQPVELPGFAPPVLYRTLATGAKEKPALSPSSSKPSG